VLILCFSCTSRTIYKKPENLISKEQMVDLWVDITIAHGAENIKNMKAQKKINYMRSLYKKYNIDSTRFMESNIYYSSKIEEYEKMFQEVDVRLKKIKEIYDPLSKDIDPKLPIWKRDSIRNRNRLKRPNSKENVIEEEKEQIIKE
jgi:hypothetical protein